jgi:hypothetical protein
MIHAFKQIRLTNNILTVTGASSDRLQVGSRQVVYTDETGNFGAGGNRVSSINSLTGALSLSGYGNITVTTDGINTVRISGDVSNLATTSNLNSTGQTLQTQISAINTWTGRQQSFSTSISPTGLDNYFISFPTNFSIAPKVVSTVEVTGDVMYSSAVRNRTVSGYTVIFSDTIAESGVVLHTIATIN